MDLNQRDRSSFRNTRVGYPSKRARGRRWWKILVPLLLACGVLAALGVTDYWVNHSKIYPGVSVGDLSLGGKTPEEARKVLEQRTEELKEIKLTGPQQFTISSDKLGVNFDVQSSVDQAYAVGRQGDLLKRISDRLEATWGTVYTPLAVSYKRQQLQDGLSDVFTALTAEPVDAGFRFDGDGVSVTKSQTGMQVEKDKLLDDIEAGLLEGRGEYEVPVITQEPKLTTQEAEKLKPTTVLARYRTDYRETSDKSKERVENLSIASNAVSGRALAPGDVFSMVDVTSPLSYNKTSVIINGVEDKADGGGLCQ
ncbi:MAG: peptidoglycan binding domain-containing protein, partial [Rubrobacter sp.]|nr:peptidoglycan binding domain-containing protein [Rubrobacter sp.]